MTWVDHVPDVDEEMQRIDYIYEVYIRTADHRCVRWSGYASLDHAKQNLAEQLRKLPGMYAGGVVVAKQATTITRIVQRVEVPA